MFLPRSPPALMAGSSDSCLFQKVFFTMTPENFGNLTVKCCSKTLQNMLQGAQVACCSSFECRAGRQTAPASTGYRTTQADLKTQRMTSQHS